MRKTIIELTSAQINNLSNAPVSIVPAPGSGRIIIPITASIQYSFGTIGFGEPYGANAIGTFYGDFLTSLVNGHSPPFVFGPFATFMYPESMFGFGSCAVVSNAAGVFSSTFALGNLDVPLSTIENRSLLLYSFAYGSNDGVDFVNYGAINDNDLHTAGSGYSIGDTGTVGARSSSSNFSLDADLAAYVVDGVNGSGGVTDYHLSSNGYGYKVGVLRNTSVLTGSGDNNFKINVNSITPGDGSAKIIVIYDIINS